MEKLIVDLVPITERFNVVNEAMEQVVSARAVHKGLEVKEQFTDWWKRCLPFITGQTTGENQELLRTGAPVRNPGIGGPECIKVLVPAGGKNAPDREADDYLISVDSAKILCMVSRTKKSDAIRRYFIEVEKAWNDLDKSAIRTILGLQHRVEKRTRLLRQAGGLVLELRQENTGLKEENQGLKEKVQGLAKEMEGVKEKIGELETYFTIKRMEIKTGKKYNCWKLINYSKSNGYEIKKVEDAYFNEVNAYHTDVWKQVYQLN